MRLPRRTVRLKLTLLFGALFLVSGGILLTITNLVVRDSTPRANISFLARGLPPTGLRGTPPRFTITRGNPVAVAAVKATQERIAAAQVQAEQIRGKLNRAVTIVRRQPSDEFHSLLITSLAALAAMTVISIALGWLVAGRVLRPLRTITAAARDISASNLDRRLALDGPNDELHELGGTFDGLLGRLETSFEAQRQFVANASHELRTPLARQRTVAEVALSDPEATVESLRESHERVLAAGEQQERLIEALLTLARSERGLARRETFDLATVTEAVVATRGSEIAERDLRLEASFEPAAAFGEPRLAERLVANLLDNAIRHNVPSGAVRVATRTDGGQAAISVTNTGPVVPPDEVERLRQPFQRLDGDRVAERDGVGLGLSIADAIARAHGGELVLRAQPDGGLAVEARIPS
jgi:signal transduction histidine kinase